MRKLYHYLNNHLENNESADNMERHKDCKVKRRKLKTSKRIVLVHHCIEAEKQHLETGLHLHKQILKKNTGHYCK